ncbi:MAG TPA: GNAT family N-acetyltransferase [Armatimonadetes bacterium]|nr:GNAT family N-acetyltransferase [Armatimonadota bacterium]
MRIRQFQVGDETAMERIAPRAFMGRGLARLAIDASLPREAVAEEYRREARGYAERVMRGEKGIAVFVAEEDNATVGYIVVGVRDRSRDIYGFLWGAIISLAVDPEHWGKGIGSALIAEGLKWLKQQGVKYAEVSTDQNNIPAIRAYEKNGFRVVYSGVTLSQFLD